MLDDVKEELIRKNRDLKVWIEGLDDEPNKAIERGLYFVYSYGIFEWLVNTVIQRTIEEINAYDGSIKDYTYDIYPLIFADEFDAIYSAGNKTKWQRRSAISHRLINDEKVHINPTLLPTDGRNIQVKQLESIASVFGKCGDVVPNPQTKGYLIETVENRNHIAHGDETPGEVGAKRTKSDIVNNFLNMQMLSEYFLNQYDEYVNNKEFLRRSVTINEIYTQ